MSSKVSGSILIKSFRDAAGSGSMRFLMTDGNGVLCMLVVEMTDAGAGGALDAWAKAATAA